MDKNRPTGRQKNVTAGSSDVSKKGSGLGTGSVGNSHRPSGTSHLNGGGNGAGGKRAAGGIGIVAILFIIIKMVLGGGVDITGAGSGSGSYDFENVPAAESYVSNASSTQADMSVADSARDKRTVIAGDGSDVVTIMVYMCGTDLESRSGMATNDLNEMLGATLSDNVNLIIYTGGCKAWKNQVISSDVNQIYQIKDNKFVCLEDNMGDATMVDPATLTEFINYCKKNFPANRNDLIFWDHGGGSITGYGYDEKYKNAGSMNLAGIDTALANSGITFDFIGFDACLMATIENGLMLDKYADYMIASEETEPGVGWYYTNWLTKLAANPGMSTVEIGKNIVDDFVDVCNQKCRGQQTTLSIVDLAELSATVPDKFTNFAVATKELIQSDDIKKVSKARHNTRTFAQSSHIDQIDLVDFCDKLDISEGNELSKAIKGAVKYNRTATSMTNAYGLAAYFPYEKKNNASRAVALFKKIGMNTEYTKCINEFAAMETAGDMAQGGQASPLSSLGGSLTGGGSIALPTGGSQDMITQMLGGLLTSSSNSAGSYGMDSSVLDLLMGREISDEQAAEIISNNYFDETKLVWTNGKMNFDEEQWDLVADLALNVFVDDGFGYIDLGYDNVYSFDEDGALIGEYDNTWLAIDGQIVPYYYEGTSETDKGTVITGYVPCLLNGERAELMLAFDDENPNGYITGARYVYKNGETDAIAKALTEVVVGDMIAPICDYYTYEGEYEDTYQMKNTIAMSDDPLISNIEIRNNTGIATYRFTDIYNHEYWTPVIK